MPPKSMFATKTFWFNVVTTILDILALTEFGAIVPKSWAPAIALVQGIGNIALRRMTSTPATFSGSSRAAYLLIAALVIPSAFSTTACGGVNREQLALKASIGTKAYAASLKRMQEWEIDQHRAGKVTDANHAAWQNRFDALAAYGEAANKAIAAMNLVGAREQALAIIGVLDGLITDQVVQLTESQQFSARIALEAMRTAVLVWSATIDARLGDPATLAAVRYQARAEQLVPVVTAD
jgi:hypothetical protein